MPLQDTSTPSLALEVLRCLVARGPDGGTCQEIERTLRKGHRAVSARLRELEKGDYISKTSRKRRIWGGRLARVYMANGTGVELVADATRTRVE